MTRQRWSKENKTVWMGSGGMVCILKARQEEARLGGGHLGRCGSSSVEVLRGILSISLLPTTPTIALPR